MGSTTNAAGATGAQVIDLTAGEIASPSAPVLANVDATYQLNVAPYTRYRSTGSALLNLDPGAVGSVVSSSITDSTTPGRALLTAASVPAQKALLLLGTAADAAATDFTPAAHEATGGTSHAAVVAGGASGFMTGAQATKLAGIEAGAQVNPASTDALGEGSTNLYHTDVRVRATVLTGLSLADASDVASTDTVVQAAGKLQAQIDAVAAGGATSLPVQNNTSTSSSSMAASTAVVVGQAAEARASTPTQYPASTYLAPAAFTANDWVQTEFDYIVANPTVGDFRGYWPLENFQVDQTTPTFVICYPRQPGSPATNIAFTWEVRKVGSSAAQQQVGAAGEHTMRWLQELERGALHEWRCKRSDITPGTTEWSAWRPFKVRADASTWIFKPKAQTLADIKAKAHPRARPLDLEERIRLYQTGGALRAYTTAAISTFTGTWSPLAIPTPGTYTVNNLMTEFLIQVNCWWLEQIDGGGTYKTEQLRRLRAIITGGSAFTPAGVPNNTSTDIQSIRTLCLVLAAGWDLLHADLTAGDKADLLALADAKIDLLFDNVATGVSTLDGILGFSGLWRSVTYTNRLYLTYACACFAGDTGLSGQMVANTDTAAARVEFLTNWWHNFGTHDGINSEADYYASTAGFLEPNIIDMAAGLIDRDIYTARPHIREWVEATAVMFPYTSAARLYPFSDSSDTSTGSVVKNMGLAFKVPPPAVTQWLNLAFPTTAAHAAAQAGQATSFLNRAPRPVLPNVRKLGSFHPDAGLASSSDGKYLGVEFWQRCSYLGSHTHFMADHASYVIGHGGKTLLGFPGMYKWSPSVSSNPRRASCKSIAHNTIGMDLTDYDGGGGGTYLQCLGQQKWTNQLTGTESHLMKTRGRFPYERETAAYQALVADATEAYWDTGYTLSKAWRATIHIRPGLFIFIDACDSSSGAHTWHHQFKSAVLPTYSAPWVTVSDSPGLVTLQVPYASGTVSRTLGNQGWWDAQTPTTGTAIPAAPYNNSFDLPSATSMRMAVVAQVGSEAVTGITGSKTGDVITVSAAYQGRPWTVNFNDVTGALTIDGETDASSLTPFQGLQGGLQFKDDGTNLGAPGAVTAIDVTGAGGSASLVGTTLTLNLAGGGAAALDDLSDVVITAPATGHLIRHNGTNFVNALGTTHFEAAGAVSTHAAVTSSVHGITAAAATVLDDASVAAMVNTLGGASSTGTGGLVRADSPALTGTPSAPTAAAGTSTTQLATTAFVQVAKAATVRAVSTTTDTLLAADANNVVDYTNAGAIAVSITTAMNGLGTTLTWPASAGTITLTPTGVTLNGSASAIVLSQAGGACSIIPIGTNAFRVLGSIGDLVLADISNMSADARSFNAAADNAAMRTALGVGTGGGDFSSNTATSVDGEVVLMSGTNGKTGKRATGTGLAKLTSGVLSTAAAGTDYVAPGALTASGLTMATARLIGRSTAATGAPEEISIGAGLSLSAGTLSAPGGGSGTVTDFSAGDLAPLFTTSEATTTTTPALSFALANAAQNAFFAGPASGGAGVPSYRALATADYPTASVTLAKMADMATASLLGRSTAGTGVPEVLSASAARTLLALVPGTDVQAYDADLAAIAALTSAANKVPYSTGAQTWALADFSAGGRALANAAGTADTFPYFSASNTVTLGSITAAGRALLDDADSAAQRTTLSAAARAQSFGLQLLVETPSNKTYVLVLKARVAFTITEVTAKTASGTCTVQTTIDGVNVTGGSVSVTSTEASSTAAAANSASVGSTVAIVVTSNSAAADLQVDIGCTVTLA